MRRFRTYGIIAILILSVTLSGCFGFLKREPEIVVEGIEDGMTYEQPVTPIIKAAKGTIVKSVTLNNEEFESGTQIASPGEYTLVVIAEHEKSKKAKTFEIKFTLDISGPIILIDDVADGATYYSAVTPAITTLDPNDEIDATLNDDIYTLGTPITEPNTYTLKVTATNVDNKTAEVTITFTIVPASIEFGIDENGTGFGHSNGESMAVNTDLRYVRTGERSIQFVNKANTKSAFRIHRKTNYHPDWPNDWSIYDSFSFWVYIEDVSLLSNVEFKLYTPSNPYDKGNSKAFAASELVNGWNRLDVFFEDIMTNMDDLKNMGDKDNPNDHIWIDIIVRSPNESVTVYLDDFILYHSDHFDIEDL